MKKYTIQPITNVSETFTLIVTPTVNELRNEIKRIFRKIERETGDLSSTAGMFSPTCLYHNPKYLGEFTSDMSGFMFLSEDMLGAGYVAHECLHAAMAHERQRVRFDMSYGSDCNDHEERLAYYLTYCVKAVWNTLIDNGHVKGKK